MIGELFTYKEIFNKCFENQVKSFTYSKYFCNSGEKRNFRKKQEVRIIKHAKNRFCPSVIILFSINLTISTFYSYRGFGLIVNFFMSKLSSKMCFCEFWLYKKSVLTSLL